MKYLPVVTLIDKPATLPVFEPQWKAACQSCRHLVEQRSTKGQHEATVMLCALQPSEGWQAEINGKRPYGYAWAARFEEGGVCGQGLRGWEAKA